MPIPQITRQVAIDLMRRVAYLFFTGTGTPIAPGAVDEDLEWSIDHSLIDEVPISEETMGANMWINDVLMLMRWLHGVLAHAIIEGDIEEEI